ncbi:hypothetical protein HDU96_005105 [Phlyctochytrium bullatum]|nr:hypothetical protein HDU96_005105 [Phlyctochytrium bullatum]
MSQKEGFFKSIFKEFSAEEKRNIALYTTGVLLYKFVLETMGACISGIVLNRLTYDWANNKANPQSSRGLTWTSMLSINLAMQCIGSMLIGPLVKRFRPGNIFGTTVLCFSLALLVVPILEASTGGKAPLENRRGASGIARNWGSWTPYLLYLLFPMYGLFQGMVDLLRRTIPNEIVGGDAIKLKKMDAVVHFWWEVAGTAGAILSINWINFLGWAYALGLISGGFFISSLFFFLVRPRSDRILRGQMAKAKDEEANGKSKGFWSEIYDFLVSLQRNIWVGAKLTLTQRALFWLLPAYTLPLILHRYLEGTVFPFYARSTLLNTDLQNILTGGSNFGEAMGAVLVLYFAKTIKTPIPYLRLDAILILLIWVVPFWNPASPDKTLEHAWALAPIMAIISFGWSCGDVALAAYVQSRLDNLEFIDSVTSPLNAVMSFLYVCNLVVYFTLNNLMGRVYDEFTSSKRSTQELYIYVAAVAMTAGGIIVYACTYLPRGSASWNPDPDVVEFDDAIFVNGHAARKINEPIEEDVKEAQTTAVVDASGELGAAKAEKDFIVSKN